MIKFIGIISLIVITTLLGNYFSLQLKRKNDELKTAIFLVDEILFLIRSRNADVFEIAEKLTSSQKITSVFPFIIEVKKELNCTGKSFAKIWKTSVNLHKESALSTEEKALLIEIGENIGASDTEGQISFLTAQKSKLEQFFTAAKEELTNKSKVYRSLGVLSGAFIALLLI